MSETIIIELTPDGATAVRAGAVSPDGNWLRDIAPSDLPREAGRPAVAVLNGAGVTCHRLALPPFAQGKLLKILPGLMDEKMATVEGDRHYALFSTPDNPVTADDDAETQTEKQAEKQAETQADAGDKLVAVMNTDILRQVSHFVRELGLELVGAVADYMLLPVPAGGCNAGHFEGRVCVRRPDGTGFTVEEDTAVYLLGEGETPEMYGDEAWKRQLATAANLAHSLLQGAFAPRGNMASGAIWFRRAGVLAAASLLLWVGSALYQASENYSRADRYYAEAEAAFRKALPDVSRIVNMDAQMRRAVADSRQSQGSEFLILSDLAFRAVERSEQTLLEGLRYDAADGAVVISVSFASFAQGEAFKQQLQSLGAGVQEGGSRQEGSRVFSELTIRRGS